MCQRQKMIGGMKLKNVSKAKNDRGDEVKKCVKGRQPSGFQEQEIKAQCESRIFNKLLPEISFRIALWRFHFGAKMEIKVVSGAALTSRKKLFQIQLKFAQAFPHLPEITTTKHFWLWEECSLRKSVVTSSETSLIFF